MERNYPIYTIKKECQDCYKCVRVCPVKAIKVCDGHATVMSENCLACGSCYRVCPSHAKHVRSDIEKVKQLLAKNKNVYASVAPSWAGVLGCDEFTLVGMLKKLGFKGVSETALGAQQVSAAYAEFLNKAKPGVYFSSACPVCADYIVHYAPQFSKNIVPFASPALTHAKMLKKLYGNDAGVVFIGPCIAKKNEADKMPELLDAAITFNELRDWLFEAAIDPLSAPKSAQGFVPSKSSDGALYPLEGGMLRSLKRSGLKDGIEVMTVSGLKEFCKTLEEIGKEPVNQVVFIETLSCKAGCIKGPCTGGEVSMIKAFLGVEKQFDREIPAVKKPEVSVRVDYSSSSAPQKYYSPEDIAGALARVGKYSVEDELNCDGCGYNTCRNFARALLDGRAEPSMCVSYMRKTALRKANAILRCIPSGVAIFDRNLEIIESNIPFAKIAGKETEELYAQCPGLKGACIYKLLPFEELFSLIFNSADNEIRKERVPYGTKLLDMTLFVIEKGQTAGLVVEDVTTTELHREIIAQKAKEVLRKNIMAVQDVAGRLGENIAETEIILNYITEGFGPDKKDK